MTNFFPPGNQLWKLKQKYGKDRLFAEPDLLMEQARKYFTWCDENPLHRVELVKFQGAASQEHLPLGRPYTMDGLTTFLGVTGSYFRTAKSELRAKVENGKATDNERELLNTIETIEQICRDQNVSGAAVGIFNGSLVARIHGIADKVENHNTGDAVVRVVVRDQKTADHLSELDDLL